MAPMAVGRMQRSLVVEFTKMNGAGNDFVVIDNRFFCFSVEDLARIASTQCRRRFGIGADGLLALEESERTEADVRMRYINADGSVGTMCGNGARCLARFARDAGYETQPLTIETDAGLYRADVNTDGLSVRLYMPPPYPEVVAAATVVESREGHSEEVYPIWTGTEHAVCFVTDLGATDVAGRGERIRTSSAFAPAGVNVDFVEIATENRVRETPVIHVRTFEKGVEAETLACGTGAVASALVASSRFYGQATRVEVNMPGGTLTVGIMRDGPSISQLYLEGPADTVYRGSFEYSVS